jgi:hypothetical protein
MVEAIGNGRVLDYRDAQYSHERFLIEMKGGSLARPKIQWAHDLVREPLPASGK